MRIGIWRSALVVVGGAGVWVGAAGGGGMAKGGAATRKAVVMGVEPLAVDRVPEMIQKVVKGERIEVGELHAMLIGPQLMLRADAARLLGAEGDASSVPELIHALTDESKHAGARYPEPGMYTTRYWANRSLVQLTGQDFGFVWDDPVEKRSAAVLRWSTWYLTVLAERGGK